MPMNLFLALFLLAPFILECKLGFGYELALPGCNQTCGNMTVPYPFGTKEGCYLNENFIISCTPPTTDDPNPRAFLRESTINVTNIDLSSGELQAWNFVAHQCFNEDNTLNTSKSNRNPWMRLSSTYTTSYTKNKLTVVGCNAYSYFEGPDFKTGCMSFCKSQLVDDNSGCTGNGCCQMAIPKMAKGINITLGSVQDMSHSYPCSYAFVVEEAYYKFSSLDYTTSRLSNVVLFPLILDWIVGGQNCEEAKKNKTSYACKANSYCYDSDNGPGYRCNCTAGYQGNPYLPHGCQDIDECSTLNQPCNVTCNNLPGSYSCSPCLNGYVGDGRKDGTGCVPQPSDKKLIVIAFGLGMSMCSIFFFVILYGMYKLFKKRKNVNIRKQYYKKNGGLLLQQELSTSEDSIDRTKIFTQSELEKATDNYNDNRVLGHGGQGTVYKGMLTDGTIVAVKKSKKVDENQLSQFINEVAILSQINHRNVVKLFGCCLETEVPMLVYEFVPNGTLYHHIQHPNEDFPMTWKIRFQIAVECSEAIAYLHSSCSSPIYHRDIKSSNILLDEKYKAKISDFGTSRTISVDKTHVTTFIQGTVGYLDPEFFRSSQFSEKSDVYSFGVVLLELITSKKPIFTDTFGEAKSLAAEFVQLMESNPNQLHDILDSEVSQNCNGDEIEVLAKLIERCLHLNGRQRPTMKELAIALDMIKSRVDEHNNDLVDREVSMQQGNQVTLANDG